MCLRRPPYSVEVGCCLFDRLEEVVVDQAENIVVVISPTETAFFNRMDGVQGGTGGSGGIFIGGKGVRLKSDWLLFTVLLAYIMVE